MQIYSKGSRIAFSDLSLYIIFSETIVSFFHASVEPTPPCRKQAFKNIPFVFLGHEHELYMKVYSGHRWREPEGGFPKDFNAHNQTADDGSELADSESSNFASVRCSFRRFILGVCWNKLIAAKQRRAMKRYHRSSRLKFQPLKMWCRKSN